MEIKGIVPIIAAPFTDSGAVDYESLRSELKYMKDVGCDGATLFGIAGEYYKLTDAECEKLIGVTVEECRPTLRHLLHAALHHRRHRARKAH